jgi:GntR family transcriptional regulator of gluconate operon
MEDRNTLAPLTAPRSLAEDAADRIREQILSGGFGQGEHLVEAKIAEQLAISRGPVREAFKLLRAEGLLKEEPRRGTFVVSMSADDVRDIYGLRAALEGRAARTLARSAMPAR